MGTMRELAMTNAFGVGEFLPQGAVAVPHFQTLPVAAPFARQGNTSIVPVSKISTTIARVNQIPDVSNFVTGDEVDQAITNDIESWARTNNNDIIPQSKTNVPAWALIGNDTLIPDDKLSENIARTNKIEVWAQDATTPIPPEKLTNAPSGGGSGIPDGGTEGQVLAKASDADGDAEWVDGQGRRWSENVLPAPINSPGNEATIPEMENAIAVAVRAVEDGSFAGSQIIFDRSQNWDILLGASASASISFPTATTLRYRFDSTDGDIQITSVRVLRAAAGEGAMGGLTPEQTEAIEANSEKFSAETWAREGNTDLIPGAKLPPSQAPIDQSDHQLHLGTDDLEGSASGVVAGSQVIFPRNNTAAGEVLTNWIERVVRFDDTLPAVNIPTGITYTSSNGQIILPAGTWIVCASLNLPENGANDNSDRIQDGLMICYGDKIRHATTGYQRNWNFNANVYATLAGWRSVTGAVRSDGVTPVTIRVRAARQELDTGLTIAGAHVHIVEQLVGGFNQAQVDARVAAATADLVARIEALENA